MKQRNVTENCGKEQIPMTTRDAEIAHLRFEERWTERAISEEVGLSPAGVHQAIARLSGKKRDQRQRRCRGCKKMTALSRLCDGECADCRGGTQ